MALPIPLFKGVVFVLALLPLSGIAWDLYSAGLGPDPGQIITERLGLAAFQCLLLTLCMTPFARWTGWSAWVRVRRMLGLFTFFYACLHLLAFLQFVLGWSDLGTTFTQRPYIVLGALSFLLLAMLAATSFQMAMRRLGRGWKPLHRLVYLAVLLAWGHYLWQARSDITPMVAYGMVMLLLLAVRVRWFGWASLVPLRRPARG